MVILIIQLTDLILGKYPSTQIVFDVRRSPTPETGNWATVTYNTTIINIEDYMDISTGIFTVPIAGLYYFAWTGPNGEYIKRVYADLYLNGQDSWKDSFWANRDVGNLKSHVVVQLNKGDKLSLRVYFVASSYPKQYEKLVCYFLG